MRKSDQYKAAMMAVLLTGYISPEDKLEILETLMVEMRLARLTEEREGGDR